MPNSLINWFIASIFTIVGANKLTELEQAQFASQMLNGLAPLFTGSFLLGLLTGAFFFGRFARIIESLACDFRRPTRIKRYCDYGALGDFEYLYLFKGKYYSLGEYENLKKELALKRAK